MRTCINVKSDAVVSKRLQWIDQHLFSFPPVELKFDGREGSRRLKWGKPCPLNHLLCRHRDWGQNLPSFEWNIVPDGIVKDICGSGTIATHLALVLVETIRSSKKLKARRLKLDRDEIWQDYSSSKYTHRPTESDFGYDVILSRWRPCHDVISCRKVPPFGECTRNVLF